MFTNTRATVAAIAFAAAALFWFGSATPARAVPIFAQRYHLRCTSCHSVLPELNAFGNYFRQHGYKLPIEEHGTTMFAIRYQMSYTENPAEGSPRWTPGGIVLGDAATGAINVFMHYSLGAQGGPGGMYLLFLTNYNAHTDSSYRFGLFELPLAQSPGQRLDDLQGYGYYGAHVGLNDLPLSSPRWGFWDERFFGNLRADLTVAVSDFKGAAYGGKPTNTGETTNPAIPETGLWLDDTLLNKNGNEFDLGGEAMNGTQNILVTGRNSFYDPYQRYGLLAHSSLGQFDLQAEQWWGYDHNADGFGTNIASSGGYARVKFYPIPHLYLGARYDAQSNPFVTRDMTYYAAGMIEPFRLLIQDVVPIAAPGQKPTVGGALTVAFPGPLKY